MNELSLNTVSTMSSLEIAELTGKRHDNILKDVRKMLEELSLDALKFEGTYKDKSNREKLQFNLDRELTLTLVSGYNLKMRNAIIKRWQELEDKEKKKLPKSFAEALQLAADQQKEIEQKNQLIIASNEASIKAGEILVREFVKSVDIVDIGEKQFYSWMRDHGLILKESCQPYQKYVNRGFFTWKPTEEKHGGKFRYTLRITPRGKVWLAAKYLAYLDDE